ncbi:MAG TPA: DUF3105 domain-containing protein [Gaiella sp.]|nr:DUF3105 domain-containing protein [Gaiella sp.]
MPPKPRPRGKPKPPPPSSGVDRRTLMIAAVVGVVALAAVAVALAVGVGGGGDGGGDATAALEAAGCTLTSVEALPGSHTVTTPEGTSEEWNTDPPTSGAHYEVPAIWGSYDQPVNQAQLVHNLEHGGIFVQYGDDAPAATVEQLEQFVQDHPRGTILAPYPALGSQIALGAWVTESPSEPEKGTGYLAKCPTFDETAFAAFFDAYQFQGPERFPADSLLPGHT